MNIDITTLDLKELKALAYDFIAQREDIQNKLNSVNQEILKRNNEKVEEAK